MTMKIYIKSINTNNKVKYFINHNDTILSLKKKINHLCDIPEQYQHLIFFGKILDDNNKLKDYNISNDSVIFLITKKVFIKNIRCVNTTKVNIWDCLV